MKKKKKCSAKCCHLVALLKHRHGGVVVRAENVSQLLQTHLGEVFWISYWDAWRQKRSTETFDFCKAGNNTDFDLSCKCNSRWNYNGKDVLTRREGLVPSHTTFQLRHRSVIMKLYVRIRCQQGYFGNCTWLRFSVARCMCEGGGGNSWSPENDFCKGVQQ